MSVITFLVAMAIVAIKLFTDLAIPGWASIMVTVAFLGGVQLVTVGILGEYVGRIYDEVKQRPMFFIREILEPGNAAAGPETGSGPAPPRNP